MRQTIAVSILLTCFFTGLLSGAPLGVIATLDFIPASTLPGVPPSIRVTVSNNSAVKVVIENYIRLEVADGTGYRRLQVRNHETPDKLFFADEGDASLSILAGQSREIVLLAPEDMRTTIVSDPLYGPPGSVTLRATIRANGDDVVTTPATLRIPPPTGADKTVWDLMSLRAGGIWSADSWPKFGADLADIVISQYMSSGYAPYFVSLKRVSTDAERVQVLEQTLAAHSEQPISDILTLDLGSLHHALANRALYAEHNVGAAMAHEEAARALLQSLAQRSRLAPLRDAAQKELQDLVPSNRMRSLDNALRKDQPPAALPIEPIVECVDPGLDPRGVFLARFAYRNPNSAGKTLDIGSLNRFDPGPSDAGQPRYFRSGRVSSAAGSSCRECQAITWNLDGKSAAARRDTLPQCVRPANSLLLRPFVDCLRGDDEELEVVFGYENPNMYPIRLEAGQKNRLDPNLKEARLPTVFLPGVHHNACSGTTTAKVNIAWTLDGGTALAVPGQKYLCAKNDDDQHQSGPP